MLSPGDKSIVAEEVSSDEKGARRRDAGNSVASRGVGEATRERILDGAEALFAQHGYHGTSLRDVAEAVGSRVALISYHFGSKEVLLDRVVARRAAYISLVRIKALDKIRGRDPGGVMTLDDLVTGYIEPFIERCVHGGQGWKNYALLVARHANSPVWARVISDHFDPVAREYVAEFSRSLPEVEEADVYYAFSFMVGTMLVMVAESGRVESLSLGKFKSMNAQQICHRLLPLLVGGFEQMRNSIPCSV